LNNLRMAISYVKQAEERLKHAKEAFESENYPYVVRQCQEAVELLLKAALRLVGIESLKWYDVEPILKRERDKFPNWFQIDIPKMARYSRRLRREREPSMYGDEETGTPPNELYDYEDVLDALNMAEYVYVRVKKLLNEFIQRIESQK